MQEEESTRGRLGGRPSCSTLAPHLPPSGPAAPEAARFSAPLLTMNPYGRRAEGGQPRANPEAVLFRAAVTHRTGPGLHVTFPTSFSDCGSPSPGTPAGPCPALQSKCASLTWAALCDVVTTACHQRRWEFLHQGNQVCLALSPERTFPAHRRLYPRINQSHIHEMISRVSTQIRFPYRPR